MTKLAIAAEWMWSHRGKNIWWRPEVLTDSNPDHSAPKMTFVEAVSVFRVLEDEGLIFPTNDPKQNKTAYLVNEVKESEWNSVLRGWSPVYRYVFRPIRRIFGSIWNAIVWLISVVVAALVAGIIQKTLE